MKGYMSREDVVKKLEASGCTFRNSSTIVLAESRCGTRQLEVAHVGNSTANRRRYTLYERLIGERHGEAVGIFEKSHMLAPDQMKSRSKIESIILDLYGDYHGKLNSIIIDLGIIEDGRVLDIDSCMECDKLSPYKIIEGLKKWILDHPGDTEIVAVEVKGKMEVGFYPGEEFDKRFHLIAPENNRKKFMCFCKKEGLLKTGSEPYRYTQKIEKKKAEKAGLRTNQVIILNLDNDQDFARKFLAAREALNVAGGAEASARKAA